MAVPGLSLFVALSYAEYAETLLAFSDRLDMLHHLRPLATPCPVQPWIRTCEHDWRADPLKLA